MIPELNKLMRDITTAEVVRDFNKTNRSGLDFDTEIAYMMAVVERNHLDKKANVKLSKAPIDSLRDAIIQVSRIGLTLNPVLSLAYITPESGKAKYSVSYQGLINLMIDFGMVRSVYAEIVYKGDEFTLKLHPRKLDHTPYYVTGEKKGDLVGAYAVAELRGGGDMFEFITAEHIKKIRDTAKGKFIWDAWYEQMVMKTAVRALWKAVPKTKVSIEVLNAIENIDSDYKSLETQETEHEKKQVISKSTNAVHNVIDKLAFNRASGISALASTNKFDIDVPPLVDGKRSQDAIDYLSGQVSDNKITAKNISEAIKILNIKGFESKKELYLKAEENIINNILNGITGLKK